MKVAVVFWQLSPEAGGAHTFSESLLSALRTADTHHSFLYFSAGGATPPEGVTEIPFTRRERYARRAIAYARDLADKVGGPRPPGRSWLERQLVRVDADFVWFVNNHAEDTGDVPYLLTIFDLEYLRQPWYPEVAAGGEWERRHHYFTRHILKATKIIVPNAAGTDQLLRYFPVERERVLELPHPTPEFARLATPAYGAPDEQPPYLLYPAQFWAHKNHATLFEALAELPEYRVILVGSDKGQRERLEARAGELRVSDRVEFKGFVETDELVALYRGAHALVYLSLFGPENLPPLEAMALGCPVVVADVPGAAEQVEDAALIVPGTYAEAVACAVRELEDPAVRERLAAAGARVAAKRTPERYVAGVLEFLDEFERLQRSWRS
jgi:glycosyltransferase involved in cell wall biosynthesis